MTIEPRPKRYPPPEFPPRRPALFARTPPAIFPPILGLLGLVLALRLAVARLGGDPGPADLVAGVAVALWGFATLAYLGKLARRPAVVLEDMRVLPGRSGLAAMTMGGMAVASILSVYASPVALAVLAVALAGHVVLAALLARLLLTLPPEARAVNPTLHVSFVGVIVAAPAALALGLPGLAEGLFWGALPVALVIWGLSLRQFLRSSPPAPLRPLLAIHLAPAALLGTVAAGLGGEAIAQVFALLSALMLAVLVVRGPWLLAGGFSPLWGALTFPLAASATLWLSLGGVWRIPGGIVLVLATLAIPPIATRIYKMWAKGDLALKTGASIA